MKRLPPRSTWTNTLFPYATLVRAKVWRAALAEAPDDPVEKILALVGSDLDERICNRRHLALWSSFWGEAKARPTFAEICEIYDQEHTEVLLALCKQAEDLIVDQIGRAHV